MQRLVTAGQMQELDRRATAEHEIPGLTLMENAGRAVVEFTENHVGKLAGTQPLVVCGKGNNGGDGFVVARHLHNRSVGVTVHLLAPRHKIRGDALINLEIIERMKLNIRQAKPDELDFSGSDLLVDAMLGTGLEGAVREPYLTAIRAVNAAAKPALIGAAGKPVLAIDIPSGLDANTGAILGECVRATRTATFALPKVGFTRGRGTEMTGTVTVVDIGVPRELLQ